MNRRHFLELGAAAVASLAAQDRKGGWKVGMCCWGMRNFEPSVFDLAARIGLDGVQLDRKSVV